MKAMIFCAGLGTRFKPWTNNHPKALALVNGKSLLQRNIEYLQKNGIYDVIINVHHFPDQIISAVTDNNGWGSRITISDERREVLETGGGLQKAKHLFTPGEDFITINADILSDLNLTEFSQLHQQQKALITLAVSSRKSSRCFLFNNENRLTGWMNEQTGEQRIAIDGETNRPYAFSGISIFNYKYFDACKLQGKFGLVDAFLSLAASNVILGYEHNPVNWVDVGKPESVAIAEAKFL